jgi:hypothetical protein
MTFESFNVNEAIWSGVVVFGMILLSFTVTRTVLSWHKQKSNR